MDTPYLPLLVLLVDQPLLHVILDVPPLGSLPTELHLLNLVWLVEPEQVHVYLQLMLLHVSLQDTIYLESYVIQFLLQVQLHN